LEHVAGAAPAALLCAAGPHLEGHANIGSAIYVAALIPSLIFIWGWGVSLMPGKLEGVTLGNCMSAWLVLFTGLMFLPAEIKYHIWSQAHARFLFPAIPGCWAVFAEGGEGLEVGGDAVGAGGGCFWFLRNAGIRF
jgi:hypothetical protein